MFNLSSLDKALDLSKLYKSIRLGKAKVVFDFVPATEEHEFLVLAFFINAPSADVAVRSRVFAEMRSTRFEDTIELVFLASLDKVPTYSNEGCIEGNTVRRRLSQAMSVNADFHRWVRTAHLLEYTYINIQMKQPFYVNRILELSQ